MATAMTMVMVMVIAVPNDIDGGAANQIRRWQVRTALAIAASVLAWLTIANGLAGIAASTNPQLAHQVAPFDGRANATLADLMLQSGGGAKPPASVANYARRAIARDPLSISAYRVLGLIADLDKRPDQAAALLHYAGRLSRRDMGTQLWLIQDAVNRNDTSAALAQFDVSLRAIPESHAFLFPILAHALEDDEYVQPVTRVLASGPNWMEEFGAYAINNGIATTNLAQVFANLKSKISVKNSSLPQLLVNELIARDKAIAAYRYNAALFGQPNTQADVNDPNFALPGGLTPFAWILRQDGDVFVRGNEPGIRISAQNGRGGVVASQLVALVPARYRLITKGHYARTGADQLVWQLSCVGPSGSMLGRASVVAAAQDQIVESQVVVPEGCPMQWLRLELAPTDEPGSFQGQVTSVSLRRL